MKIIHSLILLEWKPAHVCTFAELNGPPQSWFCCPGCSHLNKERISHVAPSMQHQQIFHKYPPALTLDIWAFQDTIFNDFIHIHVHAIHSN